MEKEYNVYYRARGNKEGEVFETTITAKSLKQASEMAKQEFNAESEYTVVEVKLVK